MRGRQDAQQLYKSHTHMLLDVVLSIEAQPASRLHQVLWGMDDIRHSGACSSRARVRCASRTPAQELVSVHT